MAGPFAQITQGPATATGNNTNKQALIFDRQNNIVDSVGDAGLAASLRAPLLVLPAQTALATITTAQNLVSKSLNAGVLNKLNRTIEIYGQIILTLTGTPTVTIAVTLGGVALVSITTAAFTTGGATNVPANFVFVLTTASTGSAGTMEAHGAVNANVSSSTTGPTAQYLDQVVAVSSAVNLTTALTLNVTIAASATVTSAQLRQFILEVVN